MHQNCVVSARLVMIFWLEILQEDFKVNLKTVRKLGKVVHLSFRNF